MLQTKEHALTLCYSVVSLQISFESIKELGNVSPTKDGPKREGLHDYLEIWPVQKHAILKNNINILSKKL
jgi:hypothetical protein